MNIKLDRVKFEEKEILFRLLQYSLYEESQTDGNRIGKDAIYNYPYFDTYFTDVEREAYFIREVEYGDLLGFVMINTHVEKIRKGHSIAEFMILPQNRRQNIGSKVVKECFDRHEGEWEVSPSSGSNSAYLFWEKVIKSYHSDYKFEEGTFIFTSNKIRTDELNPLI